MTWSALIFLNITIGILFIANMMHINNKAWGDDISNGVVAVVVVSIIGNIIYILK